MPRMPQPRLFKQALICLCVLFILSGLMLPGLRSAGAQVALSEPAVLPGDTDAAPAPGPQEQPRLSKGGEGYLAVWTDSRTMLSLTEAGTRSLSGGASGSQKDVYAARLDAAGQVVDTTPIILDQSGYDQIYPAAGWNGQNWLVVWLAEKPSEFHTVWEIRAARVSPSGQVLDATPIVLKSDADSGLFPFEITDDGAGNWAVLWLDFLPPEGTSIPRGAFVTKVSSAGAVVEPARVVYNNHSQYMSDLKVARAGDRYLLTFETLASPGGLVALPYDLDFNPLRARPETLSASAQGYDLATDGNTWFVSWSGGASGNIQGVGATRVSRDGDPVDPAGIVVNNNVGTQGGSTQACWDGQYWFVVYDSSYRHAAQQHANNPDIYATRVTAAGQVLDPSGLPVKVDDDATQHRPVAEPGANGGVRVVWQEVPRQDLRTAGVSRAGAASADAALALGAPRQAEVRTATNGNGFLAVFRSETSGVSRIMGQHLDASGNPVEPQPFVVADGAQNNNPSVAWGGNSYLVVWDDITPTVQGDNRTTPSQTFGRLVPAAGPPLAPEFLIMDGDAPDVAGLNGNFLVVNTIRKTSQIRKTQTVRVSGAGSPLGTPVEIEGVFNFWARVVSFGTRWFAVWEYHANHDDAPGTIRGAFIEPNGTVQTPFVVGEAGNDRTPHLSVGDGQALVVWSNNNIIGRRVNADGTSPEPASGTPLVTDPAVQSRPAVAWDGRQYVVTWLDHRKESFPLQPKGDVYAARVAPTNVRIEEFPVADSALPEETPFVTCANGLTLFSYAKFYPQAPYAAHRITRRTSRLDAPPAVLPPAAPSGLSVTQVNAGLGTVLGDATLTWADHSDNEQGFKLERSTDGVNFSQFRLVSANTTSALVSSVSATATTFYRVRAYNAGGDSDYTEAASAPVLRMEMVTPNTYPEPANVRLAATASDPEGVARVEFLYATSAASTTYTLLSADTEAPYAFDWQNVPRGNYEVIARAFDNRGSVTTEKNNSFAVFAPPTGAITAPANGSTFQPGANVQLTATAQTNNNRSDERVTRVDFYANTTLVGTVQGTLATYTFNWANVPAGSYSLTARPTSSFNLTGTSEPVNVTAGTNVGHNISGRVMSGATPLYGVKVTLSGGPTATTDPNGNFVLTNVAAGGNYTVTPSAAGYTFSPASLTFNNLSAVQTANFNGTPGAPVNVDPHAVPIHAQQTDGQAVEGPSSKIPSGQQVDGEVADDFEMTASITRVRVRGMRGGWNAPPNPTYYGVYVRFYEGAAGKPGALQAEYYLPKGSPGVSFDAAQPTVFDVTLPTAFNAAGRHFLSVQPVFGGAETWHPWSANRGAVRGAAWQKRNNLAGGAWGPSTGFTPSLDMSFDLFGTLLSGPRIDGFAQPDVARSGLLRINGAHFGTTRGASQLKIGGQDAIIARWFDSVILAYVPEGASLGSVPVQLTTASGTTTSNVNVTTRPAAGGRIKWRFKMASDYALHRAGIGPDGTVYVNDVDGRLYALTPAGALKWIFQAGDGGSVGPVTVAADGTIYVGGWTPSDSSCGAGIVSVHGVFAVNPDGTQKWRFNRTCDTIETGPNVGPDGKIYAITDIGGIGAFALNPNGTLAWNHGRFSEYGGLGREVVFGPTAPGLPPTQLYFQFDQSTIDPQGKLFGYTLGGSPVFEAVTVNGGQPAVGPLTGNLFAVTFPIGAGTRLRSYTPQGALRWQSPIGTTSGMSAPDAAPDETVYVTVDGSVLHAVDPSTGESRWGYDDPHLIYAPVVSPDNRLILMGGRITYGQPGIFAAVGTDGRLLWKQHLPDEPGFNEYGQVEPSSRARFTNDGQTAYIAADVLGDSDTQANPVYSFFYALDTSANNVAVNQPPVVTMTSPIPGSQVARGTQVTISADVADDGPVSGVDFYVRRQGGSEQFVSTDPTAPYSTTYTPAVVGTYIIRVVARDAGNLEHEAASNFNVPNEYPRISWVSPANGSTFQQGTTITLKSKPVDPDGTITRVDFNSGQVGLIGSDATPDADGNYSVDFVSPGLGAHTLTTWANDNDGGRSSATIGITITSTAPPTPTPSPTPAPTPDPTAPAVSITSPANGSSFTPGTPVTLAAAATPFAGRTIARVDFVHQPWGQVLCTDFNAPYTCTFSRGEAYLYDIEAVARDSANVSGKTPPHRIIFEETQKVSISGRIRHTQSQPGHELFLPNALVKLEMNFQPFRETRTDAQGNYRFDNLSWGGDFEVKPSEPGYTFSPPSVSWMGIVENEVYDFVAEGPPPAPTPTPVPGANVLAWEKFYNGPRGQSDYEPRLFVDAQGNTYVAGVTAGAEGDSDSDIVTMKYDPAGTRLWAKVFVGLGGLADTPADIRVDAQGNVYVAGTSWRGAAFWQDYVTIKYDAAGNQQWVRYYNGPKGDTDEARALELDADGNAYVTGYITSAEPATGRFFWEYATVKYDAAGNEQWVRLHSTKKYGEGHIATDLAVDSAGNSYVTGYAWLPAPGGDTSKDVVTVKYSPAGDLLWTSRFNSGGAAAVTDETRGVALDPAGNLFVFGYNQTAATLEDFLLLKLNGATGARLWNRTWAAPFHDYARDMAVDASGNVYLTGETYDSDYYAATSLPTSDVATVKFDGAGNLLWERVYRAFPGKHDFGRRITLDSAGAAYVGAFSEGFLNSDVAVIKYRPDGTEDWVYRYDNPSHAGDDLDALQADASGNLYFAGTSIIQSAPGSQSLDISTVKLATTPSTVLNSPPEVTLTIGPTIAGQPVRGDDPTAPTGPTIAGCSVTFNAAASDHDGTVALVEFYNGATRIGTDNAAPYTVNWTAPAAGTYAINAMAIDNIGATRTTATTVVNMTCGGGPTPTPTPTPASAYTVGGRVTAAGNALGGVTVTLSGSQSATTTTGPDGRYSFANVAAGANCTVTPALAGYEFAPSSKSFNGVSANQTADFATAAPRVNHALAANGATATASSAMDAGRSATGTINGDRRGANWGAGGGWHDATDNTYPDWLEVAFGGPKTINEIDVFSVQDNFSTPAAPTEQLAFTRYGVTAFEARYWDEASASWKQVPGATVAGNNKVWRKLTFEPLTTTKIRIVVTGAMASYSRVTEVEAWGVPDAAPPARVNVAAAASGATVAASSTLDAGRAAQASINGDRRGLHWGTDAATGSGWHDSTNNTYPDWLEVTFSGAKSISEVSVFSVQDAYAAPSEPTEQMTFAQYGVTGFQIEYWTGSGWQIVPGGMVTGNHKVWRKLTFAPLTTTKLRIVVKGALAGHSRVTEVEAY